MSDDKKFLYAVDVTEIDEVTGEAKPVLQLDGVSRGVGTTEHVAVGLDGLVGSEWVRKVAASIEQIDIVKRMLDVELHRLRNEVRLASNESGAEEFVSDDYVIQIGFRKHHDRSTWHAVKEFIPEEELIEEGVLKPAHSETVHVPEQWDLGKLKRFFKRGDAIRKIVERSTFDDGFFVKVARKGKVENG
jgi:hypothetical protein